jgi:hypothetical protein
MPQPRVTINHHHLERVLSAQQARVEGLEAERGVLQLRLYVLQLVGRVLEEVQRHRAASRSGCRRAAAGCGGDGGDDGGASQPAGPSAGEASTSSGDSECGAAAHHLEWEGRLIAAAAAAAHAYGSGNSGGARASGPAPNGLRPGGLPHLEPGQPLLHLEG